MTSSWSLSAIRSAFVAIPTGYGIGLPAPALLGRVRRALNRSPHPFFYAFLGAVAIGLVAAYFAGDDAPGYALGSNIIYRAEIGGLALIAAYFVGVAAFLAWQGRTFRLQVGPFEADPSDATGLDEAASGFEEFRDEVSRQIEDLWAVTDDLREALEAAEDG